MTPSGAAWTIALVFLLGLAVLSFVHQKDAVPQARVERFVRTPEHQAKVVALKNWLQSPKIIRTILDARVGITAEGLQRTLEDIDVLSADAIDATVAIILQNRDVRRVVAAYTEKTDRLPPAAVRAALLEWADPAKRVFLQ